MIEVKNVYKRFESTDALCGLTMTVPQGSIYGLLGPNGAGKSTVIRAITGVIRPDAGEILIGGEPVYENPAVKAQTAYIADDPFHLPQATTLDMMKFYKNIYPAFDTALFHKLGEAFDFDPKLPMRRLSRGMRKQAAFRLALSLRPKRLILDEPVDGLDPIVRRKIWSIILSAVSENSMTVLISSHNLRELEDVCDHIGIIRKGRMLLERGLNELQDNLVKVQLVLPENTALPQGLDILHRTETGRIQQLIIRGSAEAVTAALQQAQPLLLDTLPLSLEEIFIYELGGADYDIEDFLI